MHEARIIAALRRAGIDADTSVKIETVTQTVYRVNTGLQTLACKIFHEPDAQAHAHMEGRAYAALGVRGAPVPRLLAIDEEHAVVTREWITGPTLAQSMREDTSQPTWVAVAWGWRRLTRALEPWIARLDPGRIDRAKDARRSEIHAVATLLSDSPSLAHYLPRWDKVGTDLHWLAETIARSPIRVIPSDLNPSNIIIHNGELTFIDLDGCCLDFDEWSLCKATTLRSDPPCGHDVRSPVTALGGTLGPHTSHPSAPTALISPQVRSSVLLLALADAAGLWRSDIGPAPCLALTRQLAKHSPDTPHLAAALI